MKQWILVAVSTCFLLYFMIRSDSNVLEKLGLKRVVDYEKYDPFFDTMKGKIRLSEIERNIFQKFGFRVVNTNPIIPQLKLEKEQSCETVFKDWLNTSQKIDEKAPPPKNIPPELRKAYTLFEYIGLIEGYMDDRSGTHSDVWTKDTVENFVNRPITDVSNYDGEGQCIYHSMTNESVAGKKGFVVGSLSPWVEAMALKRGAAHVTTLEYMRITSKDPRIDYIHPVDLAKQYEKHIEQYDFAASFSSIEHSGLGRFGDVLDPIGDLREMWKAKCMLKKGGVFYLGIPYGFDTTHWNLHRIYGRIRFAMMFQGFEMIGACYKNKEFIVARDHFTKPEGQQNLGAFFQPVLVLRKL